MRHVLSHPRLFVLFVTALLSPSLVWGQSDLLVMTTGSCPSPEVIESSLSERCLHCKSGRLFESLEEETYRVFQNLYQKSENIILSGDGERLEDAAVSIEEVADDLRYFIRLRMIKACLEMPFSARPQPDLLADFFDTIEGQDAAEILRRFHSFPENLTLAEGVVGDPLVAMLSIKAMSLLRQDPLIIRVLNILAKIPTGKGLLKL